MSELDKMQRLCIQMNDVSKQLIDANQGMLLVIKQVNTDVQEVKRQLIALEGRIAYLENRPYVFPR